MAKKSQIARQAKREKLVAQYAEVRHELKEKGDYAALRKLPLDSNSVRSKNRCKVTGRSRAYLRKFGVSRIVFRELALEGKLPGVHKASW